MTAQGTSVVSSRLEALRKKHAILSTEIEDAQKYPSTTDYYLKQLKKQKLLLKEQIEGIHKKAANA